MRKILTTLAGASIQIGRELGAGGEGSVYEVIDIPSQVAKLYHNHKQPDAKKQSKLEYMAAHGDVQLLDYVAWPLRTLHTGRAGPTIGFLMPKVAGREPIHMVYSPAHRRQTRPDVAWDFLLFVARNLAAAFETLHARGHVLGDVNQGNVMVGSDSKVMLIDSDSFQVNANGVMHLCEVGVPNFTPPELQGLSSFDGIIRTSNHDNFGLALLVFHLLFGGRHPYAGVPLRDGIGEALEADIKAFRYAYSRDSQFRGLKPPPRSIPVSMAGDTIDAMFAYAFTEPGARGGRPTAKSWVTALDKVRGVLKQCPLSKLHRYPSDLSKCPWCSLEQEGVVYFWDFGASYTQTSTGFVLTRAWALIEEVPLPRVSIQIPNLNSFQMQGAPLPSNIPSLRLIVGCRVIALLIAVTLVVAVPKFWFFWAVGGWIAYASVGSVGKPERNAERARRAALLSAAKSAHEGLLSRVESELGPPAFAATKAKMAQLRDEYIRLPQLELQDLESLKTNAQERQKQKFLEGIFIDSATIKGVGTNRKELLRNYGIETAADVDILRISQVKGFGDSLTRAVMDWRSSCERRFVFDPSRAVSTSDKNAVRIKWGNRKLGIEHSLNNGPQELRKVHQEMIAKAAELQPRIHQSANNLAQALKDLSIV